MSKEMQWLRNTSIFGLFVLSYLLTACRPDRILATEVVSTHTPMLPSATPDLDATMLWAPTDNYPTLTPTYTPTAIFTPDYPTPEDPWDEQRQCLKLDVWERNLNLIKLFNSEEDVQRVIISATLTPAPACPN